MAHGYKGDVLCTGTWTTSGKPCRHIPRPGHDTCAAHDPAGDQRRPPPPDEVRCITNCRESGERCRRTRIPGTTICRQHGGNAPQIRKATKARDETRKARAIVETYGLPIDTTPQDAILAEVCRTAGHVAWLERAIHALEPDDLTWGVTRIKTGGDDRGETQEAAPHALLKLYQQERAHLVRVCAAALTAGIAERQVKLAEAQGAMVAKALRAILGDLNLTDAQKALIPTVVPEHLRALQMLALTN